MVFVASGGFQEHSRNSSTHAVATPSASFNADVVVAVTPPATLAEPCEGQLVRPGFSTPGGLILDFMCLLPTQTLDRVHTSFSL